MRRKKLAIGTAVIAVLALAWLVLLRPAPSDVDGIRILTSRDHFVCAGIGYIDTGAALDMPAYYFVDATRTVISSCGFWHRTPLLCPPPLWTVFNCDVKYEDWIWEPPLKEAERDLWQKPAEVIAALKLPPNAVIASIRDTGGYFPVRLARAVPDGRVYVVEYGPPVLRYIARRARHEKLANIFPVDGGDRNPRLPVPVDLIVMFDDHSHIDGQRESYFRKLRDLLKPGGRVAMIDHRPGVLPMPSASATQTKQEFAKAGYVLTEEHEFLPRQYFLVFRPGAS